MKNGETRTPTVGAVERRDYGGAHVELRETGDARGIGGVGIPVGVVADIGYFTEEIDEGALADVMSMDVRGLFNHDDNFVLGRSGGAKPTMSLTITSDGIEYEIPELPASRADVLEAVERGDVDGSSHSFIVKEDAWTREDGKKPHRRILQYERVFDMGPVAFPAYEGAATVSARSLREAREHGAEIPDAVMADAEERADVDAEERAMSDGDLRNMLHDALQASGLTGGAEWTWVADVFSRDGYLVFETSGSATLAAGYYRLDYEIDDDETGGVRLGDSPVRVRRTTVYVPTATPADGAGGEPEADSVRMLDPANRTVPRDVSNQTVADRSTEWSAPKLADFSDESWDDLSDDDRRKIAGHFAWSRSGAVPETFGDLALPHHRASDGRVVWRGLVAAAARLEQTEGLSDEDVEAVRSHLAAHYEAYDETAPWDRSGPDAELSELRDRVDAIGDAYGSLTARVARSERELKRLGTLVDVEGAVPS